MHNLIVFAVLTAALAIGLPSGYCAYGTIHWLGTRKPEDYWKPKSGPVPTRESSVHGQLEEQFAFKWKEIGKTGLTCLGLLFFGVAVPTALFALAIKNYNWLVPNDMGFVRDGHAISALSSTDLSLFVLSQLGKSALLDFLEIMRIDISTITYRAGDIPIQLIVLAYRTFVELFVSAFLVSCITVARIALRDSEKQAQLKKRLTIGWWAFRA